jgi:hypothetical protein
MSSFICDKCGKEILDSDQGYITGCEHYPLETLTYADRKEVGRILILKKKLYLKKPEAKDESS